MNEVVQYTLQVESLTFHRYSLSLKKWLTPQVFAVEGLKIGRLHQGFAASDGAYFLITDGSDGGGVDLNRLTKRQFPQLTLSHASVKMFKLGLHARTIARFHYPTPSDGARWMLYPDTLTSYNAGRSVALAVPSHDSVYFLATEGEALRRAASGLQ